MPYIFGIGLHVIIAIYFAIHAIRHNHNLYWLIILFSFPLFGSIVYFFVNYVPDGKLEHGIKKAGSLVVKLVDPHRELRDARKAFELSPSAQNRIRLGKALLAKSDTEEEIKEAALHFEACLQGAFAQEPDLRLAAAEAQIFNKNAPRALELLNALKKENPNYRPDIACILFAKAYTLCQQLNDAKQSFEQYLNQQNTLQVRAEYAIWAAENGDTSSAQRLHQEILKDRQHWPKHTKRLNRSLLSQVNHALKKSER